MTIVEAITLILTNAPNGMTGEEIYNQIIERELYVFNTKTPISIVNQELRRHCENLNFATSSKNKMFSVVGEKGRKAVYALNSSKNVSPIKVDLSDDSNSVPEEKVEIAYAEHIETVSSRLIETIITCSPSFFEHLVIDLLLAMGYGSDKESGVVIGRSHDGGIDGVISEDRLGLDQIYIQAKRYAPGNTVGRKELQSFVGAMQNINKGVFITTSSFTKEAIRYVADQQQKNLRLINGQELAKYMIKYQVGIVIKKKYEIVDIDSDYFE